jgi:hypothetical protein
MPRIGIAILALLLLTGESLAEKTRRTYYTDAKLRVLAENLKQYDWARQQHDAILKAADRWLRYDDRKLRSLVPPPEVCRDAIVHFSGCPVHGEQLLRAGQMGEYNWKISPDEPYKVRCPVGGEVYPSNDFAAFLAGGRKDRTLLVGPYADDGRGWQKPGDPKKFWFVAYYAHWAARSFALRAIEELGLAYLVSSEPKYAHACAVLLWQLAEHYPRYEYENQSRHGAEFDHGYKGRLLYHTWEAVCTVPTVALAYDAVWPAIDRDQELQSLTGQSGPQIRRYIERRMLRQMAIDITDGSHRICGNYGMHQLALLRVATVLDENVEHPTRQELIGWILNNSQTTLYTDQGLYDALYNLVQRDGYPFESPGYSLGWVRELQSLADELTDEGVDLFRLPRFRKLFSWPLKLTCGAEFAPSLGDSNHMFANGPLLPADLAQAAFRRCRDPAFARTSLPAGTSLAHRLFEEPMDEAIRKAAAEHPGPIGVNSQLLPAVGFASLQTGNATNRTAVSVFYGFYHGHAHHDRLHVDLFSQRSAMLPDFGYPETATSYDPRRWGFFAHTMAHNTVMVNARRQADGPGRLCVYDPGRFVQTVEVAAESAYPSVTNLYRRTLMLVEVTPDQAYLVDIFRVRGGSQHDWIVHGTQAECKTELPLSTPQAAGTLAGPDVPYGRFYDDPALRDAPTGTISYVRYMGSGFQYLFHVQRGQLNGCGTVSWHLNRPEDLFPNRPTRGIVLRAHLAGRQEQIILADGRPQARATWPETVKFLLRRRQGKELQSTFVTVFEPYKDRPFITAVRPLEVAAGDGLAVALEIRLQNGRQLVFSRLEAETPASVPWDGQKIAIDARAAVLSENASGAPGSCYLLDGRKVQWHGRTIEGRPAGSGLIRQIDFARSTVTLTQPLLDGPMPAGAVAIVENPGHAAAIPLDKICDPTAFVADDDFCNARLAVSQPTAQGARIYETMASFARPGMTVVNAQYRVLGRLKSLSGESLVLDGGPYRDRDFPKVEGDRYRHVFVMAAGPGDRIVFHHAVRSLMASDPATTAGSGP